MNIASIETYQVDLPYSGGVYRLSGGREFRSFDATIVKVTTDTGIEGWGESTPFGSNYIAAHAKGVRAGLEEVAPSVLGMDPRQYDRINEAMDSALMGHNHSKTPIDVACWDIFGKSTGFPVCDLLGGRTGNIIPLISSISTSTDPEEMRKRVQKHRELGFLGHSIKIGSSEAEGGPMLDAELIKACLAERKPGEWFLVDANGGLSVEHALRLLVLLPKDLDFVLEAPCATWAETQSLRKRCNIPILLDELAQTEADLIQAISQNTCDGFGLKISKQGGLTKTRRQREIATASGKVMSIQETTGSEIAFAVILHMAQSTPPHLLRCALDTRAMVNLSTAEFEAPINNGGTTAPTTPGLGITPNIDVLGSPFKTWN